MQSTDTTSTAEKVTPRFVLNRPQLDQLRKAHGIESEADLAKVIGVNAATLYRVSNGNTDPSNEFMAKVALAFPSVAFDKLFSIVQKPALALKAAA